MIFQILPMLSAFTFHFQDDEKWVYLYSSNVFQINNRVRSPGETDLPRQKVDVGNNEGAGRP